MTDGVIGLWGPCFRCNSCILEGDNRRVLVYWWHDLGGGVVSWAWDATELSSCSWRGGVQRCADWLPVIEPAVA